MIALDEMTIDLLKSIQQQKRPTIYSPQGGDLAGFQVRAERLLFLADVGFIELSFPPSRESNTGRHFIEDVVVRNITPRGLRAIAEADPLA
ncbi:hypothetical protein [Gloeobacter morelensis]|uniref:Uncharacterized protein n=1 Tax=Gloeobacter morelensis MG652769 TaxID=2781736 RepID=A0ABY3PQB9_9CYAN|nr:hypothetical protein [Gloeobacter morelensis]UFP95881.1 hypothetical protein ISF26_06570 [Gloeobacter morelensis MG652769]